MFTSLLMMTGAAAPMSKSSSAIFIQKSSMMPISAWAQIAVVLNVSQQMKNSEKLASNGQIFLDGIPEDIKERHKWTIANLRVNQLMLTEAINAVLAEDKQLRRRVARELRRSKRGINIGLKLDVNKAITSFFDGVSNVFHGSSLKKLKMVTAKIVHKVHAMEVRLESQAWAIKLNQMKMINFTNVFLRDYSTINAVVAMSGQMTSTTINLDLIAAAAGNIANGQVPSTMITPTQAENALINITQESATLALRPAVTNPMELYTLPASFSVSKGLWTISINVPLVNMDQIPLPLWEMHPMITDPTTDIVPNPRFKYLAVDEGIAVDQKVFRLSEEDKRDNCVHLQEHIVCHSTVALRNPSTDCLTSLFFNASNIKEVCQFRKVSPDDMTPKIVGSDLIFFAHGETEIDIVCKNTSQISKRKVKATGFNVIPMEKGCTLTSKEWTFTSPDILEQNFEKKMIQTEWIQDTSKNVSEVVKILQDQLEEIELMQDQIEQNISMIAQSQEDFDQDDEQDEDDEWDDGDTISIIMASGALGFTSVLLIVLLCMAYRRNQEKKQKK